MFSKWRPSVRHPDLQRALTVLDLSSQFFVEQTSPVLAFMHGCAYVKQFHFT